ncbi:unnamed protein product [Diplocarpon coronariae]|nr:hypothetical protein JHW43_003576 [Diplocarpon mali]
MPHPASRSRIPLPQPAIPHPAIPTPPFGPTRSKHPSPENPKAAFCVMMKDSAITRIGVQSDGALPKSLEQRRLGRSSRPETSKNHSPLRSRGGLVKGETPDLAPSINSPGSVVWGRGLSGRCPGQLYFASKSLDDMTTPTAHSPFLSTFPKPRGHSIHTVVHVGSPPRPSPPHDHPKPRHRPPHTRPSRAEAPGLATHGT